MTTTKQRLTSLAAAAALAVTGAGSATAKEFFTLGTLGPGTSPYLVMSTFANIVNKKVSDYEIQVNATGAATKHQIDVARGKMDFNMAAASVTRLMHEGKGMYSKVKDAPELATKLRAVLGFPLGLYHITVYADSGITKLEDLKGKRVFLGPPGGGALRVARDMVAAATGLDPDKDFTSVKLGWDAAAQAFQDKQLDVYVNPTNAPSPVISQIALTSKIRFLGLTKEQLERPAMKPVLGRPGGLLGEIETGIYGANQVNESDVTTIGSNVYIATRADLPEQTIYRMTKAFWEGLNETSSEAPWMKKVTLDTAFRDVNMPLHPGAAKYYKDIGLKIPDGIMPK